MIIKKVYIFCTKPFPVSSSGDSAGNSKTEKVPKKSKILDDVNITLTVVNRDEMLSLTVKIQENLDFSLYSKQYLNLTYVMASLSTRLENLKIMASGKVQIVDCVESNSDKTKVSRNRPRASRVKRDFDRYVAYYSKILLFSRDGVDVTMPLDTMVPKAAEADTQFEKDAHWAVKNVYGINKWSVADIQRAHLSALAIAIQNIQDDKSVKLQQSKTKNMVSKGFSSMKRFFFGKSQKKGELTDDHIELRKDIEKLQEQEAKIVSEGTNIIAVAKKEQNIFIFVRIEKDIRFLLGSSKKQIAKLSIVEGMELNLSKSKDYMRGAFRMGLMKVEDLRIQDKSMLVLHIDHKVGVNDHKWNVFGDNNKLEDPEITASNRKSSMVTFRVQKHNHTSHTDIYARILAKTQIIVNADLVKDVKYKFATPIASQSSYSSKRIIHEVKTLGSKEAKTTSPTDALRKLALDIELQSPTIIIPKQLDQFRSSNKDNLNTLVLTLGKLEVKSKSRQAEISAILKPHAKDSRVLRVIGGKSLTSLNIIDKFAGNVSLTSSDSEGIKVDIRVSEDLNNQIKIAVDNQKIIAMSSIVAALSDGQGTISTLDSKRDHRSEKSNVLHRIKSRPALIAAHLIKLSLELTVIYCQLMIYLFPVAIQT